jgi:hypothetical protein
MILTVLAGTWALTGCGGEYQLLVPDQLAAKGTQTDTVLRLLRNEFAGLMLPLKDAPLRCRVEEGPMVSAHTDNQGYAGMNVPVGDQSGLFHLQVEMQESHGRELRQFVPIYVWDSRMSVVAVEYDAVKAPTDVAAVRDALNKIASNAYIIYMTDQPVENHSMMHLHLRETKLPDGAVIGWQQEGWHFTGQGAMTHLVIEDHMVSPLAFLRVKFPQLRTGLCQSPAAANAFFEAGMKVYVVGKEKIQHAGAVAKPWTDIAKTGL